MCKPISNHCQFIVWKTAEYDPETTSLSLNYSCSPDHSLSLTRDVDVCDGFSDCPNHADEAGCDNRFYCKDGSKSVGLSQVCDMTQHCPDLSDECQQCERKDLADDKHMISNKYLVGYMVVLCLVILVLNTRGLWCHVAKMRRIGQNRFASKVDSILCIQLSIYDLLMGMYIFIISLKNFQFYGQYCIHDAAWRSSGVCNFAGVLFTFSSHGSLMSVLIMGAIR